MRGARAAIATLILSALCTPTPARAEGANPPLETYGRFTMSAKLEPRVRFWVDVYAKYHTWETLLVDVRHPELIFAVVNVRDRPGSVGAEKQKVTSAIRHVAEIWDNIQAGKIRRTKLRPAEQLVLEAAEKTGLGAELKLIAENPLRYVRAQNGLRDALEDALFASGKYLPRMEALFTRFGLPPEIAYLPFVESGFNKHAVSKVGASGIWQFMPYTGKLYLRVDDVVDERNDPMRAAEAAARLMQQNYGLLGDWPLAITAYNHGTTGMAHAAREVGSRDISEIIEHYDGKSFGFASQNFYACFLAALHVAKNADAYLGSGVPRARKLEFDEFVMTDYMALPDFVAHLGIDETVFRELNPALTEEVYSGRRRIPLGYTVRVPMEVSSGFLVHYEAIPATLKFREQRQDNEAAVGAAEEIPAPAPAESPANLSRAPASTGTAVPEPTSTVELPSPPSAL